MGSLSGALGTLIGTIGIAPPIIGLIISIAVRRTYIHRFVASIAAIGSIYVLLSIGLNESLNRYQVTGTILVASLTSLYNGRLSRKGKKKLLAKKIADTLRPTIQSAIKKAKETARDTLSSDLYYGYIVGFITQILREEGYEDDELDFEIVFYAMENLSDRKVAEAHRATEEALINGSHQALGRDEKSFEDGFRVGEYDAKNKSRENLKRIITGSKLHYRV